MPEADLGRRRLTVRSSVRLSAVFPMAFGVLLFVTFPPAAGIPMGVCLVLVGVESLVRSLNPAIVSLDEKGFTVATTPWRRLRVVRWADCSPFTVFEASGFVRFTSSPTPLETVGFTDAAHGRRRRFPAFVNAGPREEGASVLPARLDGRSGKEIASLFNRYRDAYGSTTKQ